MHHQEEGSMGFPEFRRKFVHATPIQESDEDEGVSNETSQEEMEALRNQGGTRDAIYA